MERVVIYIRKASKAEESELQALVETLEKYACEHNSTVVGKYIDNGYSGCKMRRPELKRLLKDCKRGGIDNVLIFDRSHLARKVEVNLRICDKLRKYGVSLTSMSKGIVDYSTENVLSYIYHKR